MIELILENDALNHEPKYNEQQNDIDENHLLQHDIHYLSKARKKGDNVFNENLKAFLPVEQYVAMESVKVQLVDINHQ